MSSPNSSESNSGTGGRARHHSASDKKTSQPRRRWGRDIKQGLIYSKPIETLPVPDISGTASTTNRRADIENLEYIASYNWTKSSNPTMTVPGSPPMWNDRPVPFTLNPDTGARYLDQDGFRLPSFPLLALMTAADTVGKPVNWPSIDFVTDRDSLRKLVSWIDGSAAMDFRIDVELAGNRTVLFNRWEARHQERMSGRTFGFQFERATTTAAPGCEDSTAHLRDFFGFKMVVRFEVDACLPFSSSGASTPNTAAPLPTTDNLADSMANLRIDTARASPDGSPPPSSPLSSPPSQTVKPPPVINIIRAGVEVPQASILELATRSEKASQNLDWSYIFPQLYLTSTPHFYLGVHTRGCFEKVTKCSLDEEDMVQRKESAEDCMKKLGSALKVIRDIVMKYGKKSCLSLLAMATATYCHEHASVPQNVVLTMMQRNPELSILNTYQSPVKFGIMMCSNIPDAIGNQTIALRPEHTCIPQPGVKTRRYCAKMGPSTPDTCSLERRRDATQKPTGPGSHDAANSNRDNYGIPFRLDGTSDGLPADRDVKENLREDPVETLQVPVPPKTPAISTSIANIEYIGSYNWIEASDPTIIVPGSPPEWTDRPIPVRVERDKSVHFVDQQGFRCPSSVLLPLLKAVDTVGRRRLALGRFYQRSKWAQEAVALVGEHTILFNRWEVRTREPASGRSFGYNFEKAMTAPMPGCEESTGHHRIIKYASIFEFFGLKMVVRFEVDACLPLAPKKKRPSQASPSLNPDDLADALSSLNIASSKPARAAETTLPTSGSSKSSDTPSSSSLRILRGGSEQPQDRIIELTTRSENYIHKLDWAEILPQLYLSQTPHYYTGVHSRGSFFEVRKQALDGLELAAQREKTEMSLRKLGSALKMIQEIVMKRGCESRLSLVCEAGKLRVYERASKASCLPEEEMERFKR
ncbi:hypothetical protein EW146_g4426 [Bondarzewia mesenterica]|uniref:Geranylgeranyl pyrophosphate synthetase n=1 Tax=Bondarzewia mesenterica TaxID=1095465 RepID=A0A4S4LWH6_9AGAM|nr:hypothetical protein EW146_g4426 [Bondarzewia mesenterica]